MKLIKHLFTAKIFTRTVTYFKIAVHIAQHLLIAVYRIILKQSFDVTVKVGQIFVLQLNIIQMKSMLGQQYTFVNEMFTTIKKIYLQSLLSHLW